MLAILLRDADIFWLGEEMERLGTAFAADAAGFHPAERNAEIADEPAIYPNCAGVNLFGDAMGSAEVLCPDARGKTVLDVVGVTDHFVFVVEWRDRDDRAKNFFAIGPAAN